MVVGASPVCSRASGTLFFPVARSHHRVQRAGISDSDRRVPADWGQESQASSWVDNVISAL